MVQALQDAVPVTARAYLTPERIVRIVTTAASRTPQLLQCNPQSLLRAVVDLVQVGLEPGGPLGHAYLVPYKDQVTPIIGYKGYLELARRSGVKSISANIIYENDRFEIEYGDSPKVRHTPCMKGDRGEPIGAYCVAKIGDERHVEYMSVGEIEAIRNRSAAGKSGPWKTDWGQMARKTVIRRARHYWPMSVEMKELWNAASLEDRVDTGKWMDADPAEPEQPRSKQVLDQIKKSNGSDERPPAEDTESATNGATIDADFDYGPPALPDEESKKMGAA
jgi:recombination protein RecT